MVFGDGTDADVVAFAQDELEAAVQVFHVRGGRVRGQRGWTIDKAAFVDDDVTGDTIGTAVLVEQFITAVLRRAERSRGGRRRRQRDPARDPGARTARRTTDALTEWLDGAPSAGG